MGRSLIGPSEQQHSPDQNQRDHGTEQGGQEAKEGIGGGREQYPTGGWG